MRPRAGERRGSDRRTGGRVGRCGLSAVVAAVPRGGLADGLTGPRERPTPRPGYDEPAAPASGVHHPSSRSSGPSAPRGCRLKGRSSARNDHSRTPSQPGPPGRDTVRGAHRLRPSPRTPGPSSGPRPAPGSFARRPPVRQRPAPTGSEQVMTGNASAYRICHAGAGTCPEAATSDPPPSKPSRRIDPDGGVGGSRTRRWSRYAVSVRTPDGRPQIRGTPAASSGAGGASA